jgi:tryptophan synthase alpha chain
MNRIEKVFRQAKESGEGIFIPFITAGDPDFETSIQNGKQLFKAGADILELGIPFSDPIAEGPTIQASSHRSLKNGMTPKKAMEMARTLSTNGPIVFMTYYNIPLQYGLEKFTLDAKENGIDGLIIVDLPIEEADPLVELCKKNQIAFIFLVTPTTPLSRLKRIMELSEGYVYLVSIQGVTGARKDIANITKQLLTKVKQINNKQLPIAVGFGISKPSHVKELLSNGADAVIIGSEIVKRFYSQTDSKIDNYLRQIKASTL